MTGKYFFSFNRLIIFVILCLLKTVCLSQNPYLPDRSLSTLRVCFYNLENFFDTIDNPDKNDDSFTPTGENHWTSYRFNQKAQHLAKVLIAIGGMQAVDVIGVCEIENEIAIRKLLYGTPLKAFGYQYVFFPSPDRRGIGTALFYRKATFKVLDAVPIPVTDKNDSAFKTRDVLYIKGVPLNANKDTLHLFVNHWPSRYGGYAATIEKRNMAAKIVRAKIDSLLEENPQTKILLMGDFNDYPYDVSITTHLNAPYKARQSDGKSLVNMMYPYAEKNNKGTHKYGAEWGILDQFMASNGLLNDKNGLHTLSEGIIFDADFLLLNDEIQMGKKIFRTYIGPSYIGGFSDHLPIFIDLGKEN